MTTSKEPPGCKHEWYAGEMGEMKYCSKCPAVEPIAAKEPPKMECACEEDYVCAGHRFEDEHGAGKPVRLKEPPIASETKVESKHAVLDCFHEWHTPEMSYTRCHICGAEYVGPQKSPQSATKEKEVELKEPCQCYDGANRKWTKYTVVAGQAYCLVCGLWMACWNASDKERARPEK